MALGALVVASTFAACGSRTGLLVPGEGPLYDGGPLDVQVECGTPSYCEAGDPGYLYRCGQRVFQCSSIEQCVPGGGEGDARCVNPCLDSLGNDTSNGCEFYPVELDTIFDATGVCYAVFVVNQWKTGERAKIEVDRGGTMLPIEQFARIPTGTGTGITYGPYDAQRGLPANEIAVLFLSRDPTAVTSGQHMPNDPSVLANCPPGVTPAVVGDAALHGTGLAQAFHVKTNVPVVAYQMLPYGGGSARVTGATLLLPTSAWSTDYVLANAYSAPPMIAKPRAGPTAVLVASHDETHVWIKPTAPIEGGFNVPPSPAGVTAQYTLARGQYLQLTQSAELSGSAIESDQPLGVIGGSTIMDLPLPRLRADSAEQMLPPVRALGSEYVAVRFRSRDPAGEESVPWRFFGAVNGTRLTYEPVAPAGAPLTLDAGQVIELDAPGPFVVRSQDADHPFFLAGYMTGGEPYDGTGDPDFVEVVPPAQYLPRYTFFTDPTYPETNLVVVRVRDTSTGAMPDVTLDCAGVLGGWTPVGTSGTYEMTRVDLSTGDFQGVGACNNGVHEITASPSTGRFGVTVWGWGSGATWGPDDETNPLFTRWVSYGYPAGANFAPLSGARIPAH